MKSEQKNNLYNSVHFIFHNFTWHFCKMINNVNWAGVLLVNDIIIACFFVPSPECPNIRCVGYQPCVIHMWWGQHSRLWLWSQSKERSSSLLWWPDYDGHVKGVYAWCTDWERFSQTSDHGRNDYWSHRWNTLQLLFKLNPNEQTHESWIMKLNSSSILLAFKLWSWHFILGQCT